MLNTPLYPNIHITIYHIQRSTKKENKQNSVYTRKGNYETEQGKGIGVPFLSENKTHAQTHTHTVIASRWVYQHSAALINGSKEVLPRDFIVIQWIVWGVDACLGGGVGGAHPKNLWLLLLIPGLYPISVRPGIE